MPHVDSLSADAMEAREMVLGCTKGLRSGSVMVMDTRDGYWVVVVERRLWFDPMDDICCLYPFYNQSTTVGVSISVQMTEPFAVITLTIEPVITASSRMKPSPPFHVSEIFSSTFCIQVTPSQTHC